MSPWRKLSCAFLLATACGSGEPESLPPLGQIVLHFDTDATLPPGPGTSPDPAEAPALFDRLRVEVYEPGADSPCASCSRDFELDLPTVKSGKASIGIAPRIGTSGYRARVRLFLGARVSSGGEPEPGATIELWVPLAAVADEGIVDQYVELLTDNVGLVTQSAGALSPGGPSKAGTWPDAKRKPCAGAAAPGEACIPGGAFWMGSPHSAINESVRQRLVVLSPYRLDVAEVTVAQLRGSGVVDSADPVRWSGSLAGTELDDYCTYTDAVGARDDLAVNCITWDKARAYCLAKGADLPTEAQFEYAAGALESRLYPWGNDDPRCADMVMSNAGTGALYGVATDCNQPGTIGGVMPSGTGARDRVVLSDATLVEMAGNVSEWARDQWNRAEEPCWVGTGMLRDPLCLTQSLLDNPAHTVRGGDFISGGASGKASGRGPPNERIVTTGFRCARAAAP